MLLYDILIKILCLFSFKTGQPNPGLLATQHYAAAEDIGNEKGTFNLFLVKAEIAEIEGRSNFGKKIRLFIYGDIH